jgi:hypothetical protein
MRDELFEPRHRVLERHAQRAVVERLHAEPPLPVAWYCARRARCRGTARVRRAVFGCERAQPGAAEVRGQ